MKGAPRKLRKSCSLPTCSKTPGECMHCTCDGRCGQHDPGRCGVRREGNGKSCKREGCAKDATCLHSTRATCCHCRNLVSSSNRSSRKRTRADLDVPAAQPVAVASAALVAALAGGDENENDENEDDDVFDPATSDHLIQDVLPLTTKSGPPAKTSPGAAADVDADVDGASSPTSCDALLPLSADIFGDFDIGDDLLVVIKKPRTDGPGSTNADTLVVSAAAAAAAATSTSSVDQVPPSKSLPSTLSSMSLAEYEQYASRRGAANLVVVVEGTQFNLHKHPMLLESQLLNAKARESLLASQSPVPVVQLASFPGGAAAFEAVCIYAYTGELHFSADTAAALYCAVHYLNMGLAATTQARHYLTTITHQAGLVDTLLRVTQDASQLMDKHDALSVCAELHLECVDALARVLPLQLASVQQLMHFPIELFLQVTQEMLASRGPQELSSDMVRQLCVQAELAQLHRDATEKKDATAPARCLALLEQSLAASSSTSSSAIARSSSSVMHGGLKGGAAGSSSSTPEEEDDALFMKMMYDFEMGPTTDDDASSGAFADALSAAALEPLAFASRGVGSAHGAFAAAAFAV